MVALCASTEYSLAEDDVGRGQPKDAGAPAAASADGKGQPKDASAPADDKTAPKPRLTRHQQKCNDAAADKQSRAAWCHRQYVNAKDCDEWVANECEWNLEEEDKERDREDKARDREDAKSDQQRDREDKLRDAKRDEKEVATPALLPTMLLAAADDKTPAASTEEKGQPKDASAPASAEEKGQPKDAGAPAAASADGKGQPKDASAPADEKISPKPRLTRHQQKCNDAAADKQSRAAWCHRQYVNAKDCDKWVANECEWNLEEEEDKERDREDEARDREDAKSDQRRDREDK